MKALSRPQGWMMAFLCTVPLSISFLVSGISEPGHKCVCAAGLWTNQINTPLSKTIQLLLDIRVRFADHNHPRRSGIARIVSWCLPKTRTDTMQETKDVDDRGQKESSIS
ncbi:unnamed protein product [Dibothriocephalus latus]|uniref:Uncharacterized protein n=1 Tax=Dibothriocephalus latus TaxID=60516 RepID=A0A3P7NNG3_DIBLA|nr:unnamed protein product [Dibothriocephalus latus]